jgi:hypothetical protein
MDIDTHVNSIVQGIITQITSQVQAQAMTAITQKIDEIVSALDTSTLLGSLLSQKIDAKVSQLPIDTASIEAELVSRVDTLATNLVSAVQNQSIDIIQTKVAQYVNNIDFTQLYQGVIVNALNTKQINFPDRSIPMSAVDLTDAVISGDYVSGGIITKFGSTGIDDRATVCQLSILDDVTVVENNLVTQDLTVKGSTTIEGDLTVTGSIPEESPMFQKFVVAATNNVRTSLDSVLFASYADMVYNQIKTNGLDLAKLSVNGQSIVDNGTLATTITGSNLQRLGVLTELQVNGESLLSQTLYVTNKRVGINTIEPGQTLSVWDQEVELGFSKQSSNTGVLGMPRSQTLVLSSNNKNNLSILPDGSIAADTVRIGDVTLTSAGGPPATNQPKGTIVFNSNPSLGGPMGWVSLGDARWANFGIID